MNLSSLDRRWISGTCCVALLCVIVLFGLSHALIVLTVTVVLVLLFISDHYNREQQSLNYFSHRANTDRFNRELIHTETNTSNSNPHNTANTFFNSLQRVLTNSVLSPIQETFFTPSQETGTVSRTYTGFSRPSLPAHRHTSYSRQDFTTDDIMASPFFKRGAVERTSSKRRLSGMGIGNNNKAGTPLVAVGSPLSPHTFLRSPSIATPALPRVRRVNSDSLGRYDLRNARSPAKNYGSPGAGLFPHSSGNGHGDYPTHLPQYNGLGILPKVHLHPVDKPLLTEHNSRLSSPVTVKIAPPDILKPPTPSVVIPEEPHNEENKIPESSNAQEASEGGREKRKRAIKDDEESSPRGIIPPVQQDAKRRRFHEDTSSTTVSNGHSNGKESSKRSAAEAVKNFLQRLTGRKRKPPVEPDESIWTDDEDTPPVREVHEPPQSKKVKADVPKSSFTMTGTPRNAIDVSYTSSRLLREDLNRSVGSRTRQSSWSTSASRGSGAPSRESSLPPGSAASSQATEKSQPPSGTSTPRRALGLDDDDYEEDVPMLPATSSTPVLEKSDKEEKEKTKVKSSRSLFPSKKTGTLKLRSTLIKGDTLTDFSKVPTMQYTVTSEDYAQDRQADLERVRKMLENPDAKDKTDGKADQPGPSGLSTLEKPPLSSSLSRCTTLPVSSATLTASTSVTAIAAVSPLVTSSSTSQPEVTTSQTAFNIPPVSQSQAASQVTSSSSGATDVTVPKTDADAAKDGLASAGFKVPATTESTVVTSSTEPSKTNAAQPDVVTTLFSFKPVFSPSRDAKSPTSSTTTNVKFGAPTSTTSLTTSNETKSPPSYSLATGGLSASSLSTSIPTTTTTPSVSSASSLSSGFTFQPSASSSAPSVSSSAPAPAFSFGLKPSASSSSLASQFNSAAPSGGLPTSSLGLAASSGDSLATKPAAFTIGSQPSQTSTSKSNPSLSTSSSVSSATSAGFAFGGATTATTSVTNAFTKTPQQPSATPFMFGSTAPAPTSNTTTANASTPFAFGAGATATTAFGTGATTTTTSASFNFGAGTTSAPSATPAFGIGTAPSTTSSGSPFTFGAGMKSATNTTAAFGTGTVSAATTTSAFAFGGSNTATPSSNFAFKAGATPAGANTAGPFGSGQTQTSTPFGSANNTATTTSTTNSAFSFGNISSSNLKPAAPGGSITFGTSTATTASSSPFAFGATTAKPATAGFSFGGAPAAPTTTQASSSNFTFGGANSAATQSSTQSSFSFGGGAQNSNAPNATPFGSTAAPTSGFKFGGSQSTTAASNAFGAGSTTTTNAASKAFEFGKANNQSTGFNFGGANAPAPAASPFGQTNAFSNNTTAPGPFGSTQSTTPAFGSAGGGTFGAPTAAATPSKGFDFSASAGGQNSSFNFGQSPAVQFGGSTPAAPAVSPFSTPFNGASPAVPGADGMFSLGSGNTQARQRTIRTAKRRTKTTKR